MPAPSGRAKELIRSPPPTIRPIIVRILRRLAHKRSRGFGTSPPSPRSLRPAARGSGPLPRNSAAPASGDCSAFGRTAAFATRPLLPSVRETAGASAPPFALRPLQCVTGAGGRRRLPPSLFFLHGTFGCFYDAVFLEFYEISFDIQGGGGSPFFY